MELNTEYKKPGLDSFKRQVNPYVYNTNDKKEISIARHVVIVALLTAKYADILGFNQDEKDIAINIALSHEDGKISNGDDTPSEVEKKHVKESTDNYLKMYKGDFSNVKPEAVATIKKIVNAVLIADSLAMEIEMVEGYSRAISNSDQVLKSLIIKTDENGSPLIQVVEDVEYLERRIEQEEFLNGRGYYEKLNPDHKIELIDCYLDTINGNIKEETNNKKR